ncbi:MAG TPA: SagB/ThcOx family dehydrogenase [Candidatus Sulfobium mesophilum]|jgi:SagB-type dehydrogenase family enzyme|nr:SagB/ThcOx family dehydrogenase [Candidatus Sulfobium mesophilum]
MSRASFIITSIVWALSIICATAGYCDERQPIKLPNPQVDGGKPLMQVLRERSSSRSFSPEKLPAQILSNLLWAAFGINRQDTGKRTAPSAVNWQEIDIYVATAEGLYLYDAKTQALNPVFSGDIRKATGRQDFIREAPVNLIYVADFSRMGTAPKEDKELYSAADTGFISQNVYLYCASEGMATVVRGSIDKQSLAKTMKLRPDQKIILAQSVGYSKK